MPLLCMYNCGSVRIMSFMTIYMEKESCNEMCYREYCYLEGSVVYSLYQLLTIIMPLNTHASERHCCHCIWLKLWDYSFSQLLFLLDAKVRFFSLHTDPAQSAELFFPSWVMSHHVHTSPLLSLILLTHRIVHQCIM